MNRFFVARQIGDKFAIEQPHYSSVDSFVPLALKLLSGAHLPHPRRLTGSERITLRRNCGANARDFAGLLVDAIAGQGGHLSPGYSPLTTCTSDARCRKFDVIRSLEPAVMFQRRLLRKRHGDHDDFWLVVILND
jgi:hypothetical protein